MVLLKYTENLQCYKGDENTINGSDLNDLIENIQKKELECYEVIEEKKDIKLFFDIDHFHRDDQKELTTKELSRNHLKYLNDLLDCTKKDWAISKNIREDKSSYHLVNQKYICTMHDLKILCDNNLEKFKEMNIDPKVYRTYGKFRFIFSKKENCSGLVPKTYKDDYYAHIVNIVKNKKLFKRFFIKPKINRTKNIVENNNYESSYQDILNNFKIIKTVRMANGSIFYHIEKIVCPFIQRKHTNENQYLVFTGTTLLLKCRSEKHHCSCQYRLLWYDKKKISKMGEMFNNNELGCGKLFYTNHKNIIKSTNSDSSDYYAFDKEKALWIKKTSHKMVRYVSEYLKDQLDIYFQVKYQCAEGEDEMNVLKKLQMTLKNLITKYNSVNNIFKFVKDDFYDPNFQTNLNKKFNVIPIQGKLILDNKTLKTRERTFNDIFSFEFPIEKQDIDNYFQTRNNETLMEKTVNDYFNDREELTFFKKLLGYCFVGDNLEKLFIFFYGSNGNNAKTFIFHILGMIFNNKLTQTNIVVSVDKAIIVENKNKNFNYVQNNLSAINDARIITLDEIDEKDTFSIDKMKAITSKGGKIVTRKMRENTKEICMTCIPIVATNHDIKQNNFDNAMENRLIFINFQNYFESKNNANDDDPNCKIINYDLDDELEKQYVKTLLFFIQCANQYLNGERIKDIYPESFQRVYRSMRQSNEIIESFITEHIELTRNKDDRIKSVTLYELYSKWSSEKRYPHKYGPTRFYKELKSFNIIKKKTRINKGDPVYGFEGVKIKYNCYI